MSNKSDKKAEKKLRINILKEREAKHKESNSAPREIELENTILFYEGEFSSRSQLKHTPPSYRCLSSRTKYNLKKVTSAEISSHQKKAEKMGLLSSVLYDTGRVISCMNSLAYKYDGPLKYLDLYIYANSIYSEDFFMKVSRFFIEMIFEHSTALLRKRDMLLIPDDYGVVVTDRWEQEKFFYIENSFRHAVLNLANDSVTKDDMQKLLFSFGFSPLEDINFKCASKAIDDIIMALPKALNPEALVDTKSGHEYEYFIANKIKAQGYSAAVTRGSGDHGADIVVDLSGEKIVVQCKFYSSPVGNKAVQEVYSAMGIYDADQAWVVTNHSFTPAAKIAAKKLGVILLHHDELEGLLS